MDERKTRIGITHGDFNGIGYEVIIKTLADQRILDIFTPVVYGSSKVASYHKKTLKTADFNFNLIKKADLANAKRPNIINCFEEEVRIELGKSSEIAGQKAFAALEQAVTDLKAGFLDVILTAPINKHNIRSEHFNFDGHTEYFANKFDADDFLMLMVSEHLKIGMVTGHIPLNKVSEKISKDLILNKIKIMNDSLKVDFRVGKPRIAVLGLNPHAGDKGIIGTEESEKIIPAIEAAQDNNILAFGPFPADGFFGSGNYRGFDGILAMYHDQGMLPFKTIAFDDGVNFTAGLSVVRTSPAHGTGYDIAGKNQASPDSFRKAALLAVDIFRNRMMHKEISADPLPTSHEEAKNNTKTIE